MKQIVEWISVKDRLPIIPEGKYAISVLVVTFDSTYEELNPGHGFEVSISSYGKYQKSELFEESKENDFTTMYYGKDIIWGPTGDPVLYWMYMPEPPKI